MMPSADTPGINNTLGPSNRKTTVYWSGVSTVFRFGMKVWNADPTFGSSAISYVNLTSAEVSSLPSWNKTPGVK